MSVVKICTSEVTTISKSFSETLTCTDPAHTPIVAPGDECRISIYNIGLDLSTAPPNLCFSFDTEFEYAYLSHGTTFMDYCEVTGNSACLTLPEGVTLCCGLSPSVEYCCSAALITATETSVTGEINVSVTITNLCVPTIFCVESITCPE